MAEIVQSGRFKHRRVRTPEQRGIRNFGGVPSKFCLRCEAWVPMVDFFPDRTPGRYAKKDGLMPYCKVCAGGRQC